MKHLKNFSIFEGDSSGFSRKTRDIFDIWNNYRLQGPLLVNLDRSYFDTLDWVKEDIVDKPDDHVVIWSVTAEDDDGFFWGSDQAVIDDHYDEDVDFSQVEVFGDDFFINQIKNAFEEKGFVFDLDKRNILKTDASEEEMGEIFPRSLEYLGMGKQGQFIMDGYIINPVYTIRFDIQGADFSYIYIKNGDGSRFWSVI